MTLIIAVHSLSCKTHSTTFLRQKHSFIIAKELLEKNNALTKVEY